ncbi:MAG: hypothetical protein ACREV9_08940 [Burkholderiales bacterium]
MKQRCLGKNGPMVSALGLGCMGMSERRALRGFLAPTAHDGQDVFRTLKTCSVGVRWVCSIWQWNLCCSAFGLPKVRCAI